MSKVCSTTFFLAALVVQVSGCALLEAPQLGTVESGIYHDSENRFSCPLPGVREGFHSEVKIADASRRSHQEFDFAQQRNVTVNDGYGPSLVVKFVDSTNPIERIEIHMAILGHVDLRDFKAHGEAADIYRSGFGGGNYGLLAESTTVLDGEFASLAVVQFPYWEPGQSYMGTELAEAYKQGQTSIGPVEIFGLANIVLPLEGVDRFRHFHVIYSQDARRFLSGEVDARDPEAVFSAMQSNRQALQKIQAELLAYLKQCDFRQAG